MKRRLVAAILFALSLSSTVSASDWLKFVAKDRSFSFHYPKGWQVKEEPSVVEVKNTAADEELLIVAAPFDAAKTPRQLAEDLVGMFRSSGASDMQASGWTSSPDSKDKAVHFRVKYSDEGKKYDSNVILLKGDAQAVWFSFSAPLDGYDASRALGVLEKVVASVSRGSASVPPESTAPAPRPSQAATNTDKNAKAFLFVLEFALGAPLTVSQERVILSELKDGWKDESAEELRKYDQYQTLVPVILKASQSQLEGVRAELEKAVRQWIDDYRGKSDSVTIIESELKRRGKVVVAGDPPLTEMAASAYSEIMAYSELLRTDSGAQPEDIDQTTVQEIREQLKREWLDFNRSDRELVGTSPGLWICQRALLDHGSAADQEKTRTLIRRLSGEAAQAPAGGNLSASDREMNRKLANNMVTHNVLMNMQQQTFNTYMWSRGFNYHPVYGKMW
ncbi:MAG: hypothetical protein EHM61_24965 [Acidobacteria bacterium]|nr:MAG: hypothetical protein EHM61_24965 [Acidobacteriota bacterium]